MQAILVVIAWYAAGFAVASRLIDRGHAANVWLLTAALLGGAVVIPAVLAVVQRRGRGARTSIEELADADARADLLVVAEPAELGPVSASVPSMLSTHASRASLAASIGHESFGLVDTGERERAEDALRTIRPGRPGSVDRLVVATDPDSWALAHRQVGEPPLIVTAGRRSSSGPKTAVRRAADLASRTGAAVLLVDVAAPAHRPARDRIQVAA